MQVPGNTFGCRPKMFDASGVAMILLNPQRARVPYTEQNHLHGQWWEFHTRNSAQKMKENYVKMILSSLAYITLIRLPFCVSTGERERFL